MTACPTLETKRLILRPFREDDLNDYFTMMETPELRESLGIPPEEGKAEAWAPMAWWRGQLELH
jgi:RimJ/RimL family protein N-acetyltransferase